MSIAYRQFLVFFMFLAATNAEQININRIELMPNMPQPYEMRDWKEVARGYDSLVFDQTLTGTHLPLSWTISNTTNYPENASFGLHTYVGTNHTSNAEGINCIPAVVSATLVGIDKSDQNGFDYVLASQEWFNRRPSENVYLNGFTTSSGNDWWYDTMPNVFFYQLKDLYAEYGDSDFQFESVAERWLEAVQHMGGSEVPWSHGNFSHRAWSLSTMTANNNGVVEPEAAGAIGWLLYMAYSQTGDDSLRMGAEWALEFLHHRSENPSYEIQMPYGAVTAARMNAELGTNYDLDKLLNWCFDITPLRYWGATLGNWGGYDCDGLIGEAQGLGYAFAMNGYQHASALAPVARYDDRYARALGKWILNLANASRLFYPNYLPPENQDVESWSYEYDPNSYIAHESMREEFMGMSPYATGDATGGGWAATNFALYGSSHVGYLGALVDTTNVPGILQLDLLATDWYHSQAYPSYLYYNPNDGATAVELTLPEGSHDIYEMTSNQMVVTGVTQSTQLTIPGDEAWLIAIVPAGGTQTYEYDKLLIDGIVVDYSSGVTTNYPPRIKGFGTQNTTLESSSIINFSCAAEDREDGEGLSINWYLNGAQLASTGSSIQFTVPADTGNYQVRCLVTDSGGLTNADSSIIRVVERINHAPLIESLEVDQAYLLPGTTTSITCIATDEDDDELTYIWSAPGGGSISGEGATVSWTAPDEMGEYEISCLVSDPYNGDDSESVFIHVTDSTGAFGFPSLFLPFSGDANDHSSFGNQTVLAGASFVADRGGNPDRALRFDGVDDRVQVTNTPLLNFTSAISVSIWLKVEEFFGREAYPISHGNWENRWKISITDQKVRWTIKTSSGITDLDSQTELQLDTYYHIVALYDGSNFDIYLNGELDQHGTYSGTLNTTSIDLTIGQVLPGNTQYNFKGIIDDIRLYDYALSDTEISDLYQAPVSVWDVGEKHLPEDFFISPAFPNPFNPATTINYGIAKAGYVHATIHDIKGRQIKTLENDMKDAGRYSLVWNGQDEGNQSVSTGIYFCRIQAANSSQTIKVICLR